MNREERNDQHRNREAAAPTSNKPPSLIADLLWALRRGALIALALATLLIVPWLVSGVIATLIHGGSN
jgi:hypothetical protein